MREIEVNVAYRWFLAMKLTDKVFDASTFSQNRRRRYQDETIAQSIFDRIVEQAIRAGLVDGTVLYTDSTHLKANANTTAEYLVLLDPGCKKPTVNISTSGSVRTVTVGGQSVTIN